MTGRPQGFVVVLKYINFAEHLGSRKIGKNQQYYKEKIKKDPVVMRTTRIQFLVVHIYFLVVIDKRTRQFS